jgi:uncharacterized membrane protein
VVTWHVAILVLLGCGGGGGGILLDIVIFVLLIVVLVDFEMVFHGRGYIRCSIPNIALFITLGRS